MCCCCCEFNAPQKGTVTPLQEEDAHRSSMLFLFSVLLSLSLFRPVKKKKNVRKRIIFRPRQSVDSRVVSRGSHPLKAIPAPSTLLIKRKSRSILMHVRPIMHSLTHARPFFFAFTQKEGRTVDEESSFKRERCASFSFLYVERHAKSQFCVASVSARPAISSRSTHNINCNNNNNNTILLPAINSD